MEIYRYGCDEKKMLYNDIIKAKDALVMISASVNAIFEFKCSELKCIYYDETNFDCEYSYSRVIYLNNKIICVPFNSNNIVILKHDEKAKTFDMRDLTPKMKNGGWCIDAFALKNCVYMIGYAFRGVIKVDLVKEEIELIPFDIMKETSPKWGVFSPGSAIIGHNAFIPIADMGGLLRFDIDNYDYEIVRVNKDIRGINGLSLIDNKMVMIGDSTDGRNVVTLDIDTMEINTRKFECNDIYNSFACYYPPIEYYDKILVLPHLGNNAYFFEKNNMKVQSCIDLIGAMKKADMEISGGFSFVKRCDEFILFQHRQSKRIFYYNLKTKKIEHELSLFPSDLDFIQFWNDYFMIKELKKNYMVHEEEGTLNSFVDYVLKVE